MSVTRSVSRRLRDLDFQSRLTLVATLAVSFTATIAWVAAYFLVQAALVGQVDDSLRFTAENTEVNLVFGPAPRVTVHVPSQPFGGVQAYYQVLGTDGREYRPDGETEPLPVDDEDRKVVTGARDSYAHDGILQGVHVRILTTRIDGDITLQVARPLTEVDVNLARLKFLLIVLAAGGIALAAALGWLIAHSALRPIYRLRQAVDHVTETGDTQQRVPHEGQDEVGRLGAHFNRMLDALDQSLRTQRQLVADASHELRTPLASLRTNIEVLQRSPNLVPPERDRLLGDVLSQIEQLTRLIVDLIDLARGDQAPEEKEEVRLDWIVAAAVERAATNWPAITFSADLRESVVVGQSGRLDRAVSNLLDNAGKWSPPGSLVEVHVTDHEVVVRDYGAGIAQADLPFVFDRFWRAPAARGMPGSGLGLSIVRQVAEAHGGTVTAELPHDGGTLMRLKLPT